jgi:AcrR family transcriptional regulator
MDQKLSKRESTSKQILAAASILFLQQGVAQTSVESIAAAAGISRASLFNHYRGKPAILAALAAEMEPRLLQLLAHYLDKPLSTAQRIQQLFEYSARVLARTVPLTRLMFVYGSEGAGFPALEARFEEMVVQGQRQRDVRTDIESAQLAHMVYLAFVASLLGWCQHPDEVLPEQLAKRARSLVLLLQPAAPGSRP